MARLPLNAEPSLFRRGEYVGYDGRGYPWRVYKVRDKEWVATPGPSHPGRLTAPRMSDVSLTAIANRLAERGTVPAH